jgi:hypothetical protein
LVYKNIALSTLQLRLTLHPLKNRLQLRRLHNIALDLQLPAHKQLLRIRLALDQFMEIRIAQHERDARFFALGRGALAYGAGVFEVNVPCLFCAGCVLELEGEDAVALFDGVFAVGVAGGEGLRDGIEGGGGGEVV